MTSRPLQTAIPFWADRSVSPAVAGPFAQAVEASGVIDYFWVWDQLTSWWPHVLWTEENTEFAVLTPDCDSFHDAFVTAGVAAYATDNLGVQIGGTDAIRNGPAELMQTMLTLASMTGTGTAQCAVAGGELKQVKPFGYRRSEGLARMEDILRLARLLWECEGPFDFDGNIWKFRNVYIGTERPRRPEFWCLGGGPKLIELATKYADGFVGAVPAVFPNPDKWAAEVQIIKQALDHEGRDPDQFGIGFQCSVFLHEDRAKLEAAYDNPLIKWFAATAGRMEQNKWLAEGLEPPMGRDYHYALKLLPAQMGDDEVDSYLANVRPEHVQKCALWGTPAEVAKQLKPYVDAGVNFIGCCDLYPPVGGIKEAELSMGRLFELNRLLKEG